MDIPLHETPQIPMSKNKAHSLVDFIRRSRPPPDALYVAVSLIFGHWHGFGWLFRDHLKRVKYDSLFLPPTGHVLGILKSMNCLRGN